jgi:hypothetical protein
MRQVGLRGALTQLKLSWKDDECKPLPVTGATTAAAVRASAVHAYSLALKLAFSPRCQTSADSSAGAPPARAAAASSEVAASSPSRAPRCCASR